MFGNKKNAGIIQTPERFFFENAGVPGALVHYFKINNKIKTNLFKFFQIYTNFFKK
jgi:hypothetical protein